MRTIFYLMAAVLLVFSSCKKEKPGGGGSMVRSTDSVFYQDLTDTSFTSVSGYVPHGSGCGFVPQPADSIAEYGIDVDGDLTNDFKIIVDHTYHFYSASNPCGNYNYVMFIQAMNSTDSIAYGNMYHCIKLFAAGGTIDHTSTYDHTASMFIRVPGAPMSFDFFGETYIGFKIERAGKTNYGWILVEKNAGFGSVTLKSCALNRTGNKKIKAGQTE